MLCMTSFILRLIRDGMRERSIQSIVRSHKYHYSHHRVDCDESEKNAIKMKRRGNDDDDEEAERRQRLNGASGSNVADTLVTYRSMPLPPPPALSFHYYLFVFACARAIARSLAGWL